MKKFKKNSDKNKTPASQPSIIQGGRKQKRKESRKQKKELKQAFYLKKFHKSDYGNDVNAAVTTTKEGFNHDQSSEKKIDSLTKLKRQAETKRKKMLKRANKEEDATIQKLEKQLNIKNRQKEKKAESSRIPKSFMDDGLGYILELCEGGKKVAENIDNFDASEDSSNEEEQKDVMHSNADSEEEADSESEIEDSPSDEDSVNADDVTVDDDQFLAGEDEEEEVVTDEDKSEDDSHDDDQNLESEKPEKEDTWEDIYGRKRDSQGNVLVTKYVPPAMRAQSGPGDLSRLEKQLKGQLNRLAESNLQSISRLVEELYSKNSRNNMNVTLFTLLKAAIVLGKAMTPERLVLEHAALVALLHANVGIEVGANITQKWVDTFMDEYRKSQDEIEDENSKELDNLLYFTCSLYSFRVISHELIFDILFMLAEKFSMKDIELISLGLRCVGFNLRKDEPSRLKTLISEIQQKAGQVKNDSEFRVKFMLESLMAIKNNNVKKLPNYDPTYLQHLQKVIRNYYR